VSDLNRSTEYREDLPFYREQSALSSPGEYGFLYEGLPTDVHELCRLIQGCMIHMFWIGDVNNYGVTPQSFKDAGRDINREINLRTVEERLHFLLQLDDRPLAEPRIPGNRVVGNCRDYSLLLVSMLRHQGVPARVRSGVARYFYPDTVHLEDHFICEFWNQADGRWQRADAQIDDLQKRALKCSLDMADLPPNQFLDAGESYYELKEGRVEPEQIGIFDFLGEGYVNYKLVSDLASVCGVEVLPWEGWGICDTNAQNALLEDDLALLANVAQILAALRADPIQFRRARDLFASHPKLKLPANYVPYYQEFPQFKTT
jgi:hypothetical protein